MTGRETRRNEGIDLLRILSMYMVVVLHVIGQGGVMLRISSHPQTYYAVWLLETAAFCAVNCYGLISGYVGVTASFHPARILSLWLTVWFYSLGITAVAGFFHPGWINQEILLKSLFPVLWKTYWYFTGYVALALLMPFLNKMMEALSGPEIRRLFWVLFVCFSVATMVPKIFEVDTFSLTGGYTFLWLLVLYLLGACLRLGFSARIRGSVWVLLYLVMAGISWISKILIENHTRARYGKPLYGRLLVTYHAPTIVLCGVALLLAFRRLGTLPGMVSKLVRLCAPASFAVYIIHTHPILWEHVLKNAFQTWAYLPAKSAVPLVLLAAAGIFLPCLLTELIRQRLFAAVGIPKLLGRLEIRMKRRLDSSRSASDHNSFNRGE